MSRRTTNKWFPFYPQDWLFSETVNKMSQAEQGLHIRMLALAWLSDDFSLPADIPTLVRLVKPERKKHLERVIELAWVPFEPMHGSVKSLHGPAESAHNLAKSLHNPAESLHESAKRLHNVELYEEGIAILSLQSARRKGAETLNSRYAHRTLTVRSPYAHRTVYNNTIHNSNNTEQDRTEQKTKDLKDYVPPVGGSVSISENSSGTVETGTVEIVNSSGSLLPAVKEVFSHWQQVMNREDAKLTLDRRRKIEARLNEKYSTNDLKLAIDGCASSPFHMGENTDGRRWDDLTLICRSGSKVEEFVRLGTQPEQPVMTSTTRHNMRALQQVLNKLTEQKTAEEKT